MTAIPDRLSHALASRYSLEDEIGQGGMATVYLAEDIKHHRKVAVKVLRPDLAVAVGADRFLREIELAARLTHPHILPLHDSGNADGFLFYVMPYIDGESLRARLERDRQLGVEEALLIAREVADALAYAHAEGVIHRDVKPENILLSRGHAVVADFGIGKAVSAAGSQLTQTGVAVGTPAYMSPEQAAGESRLDGRSDVYSLGCVLFEMLVGSPPFAGATAQETIARRFTTPVPDVRELRESVPAASADAVRKALARTPADRFATAAEFLEALKVSRGRAAPEPVARAAPAAGPLEKSIAVVPLANMSADPENEYFSDGMTEEIINALAKVTGLQVASRTSSFSLKGKDLDVREIGERLGVATVLEGSVRKAGKRIRITAQLINVANGYHLWSETYDRQLEDVFAIQDDISRAIVEALKVRLVGDGSTPLVVPTTANIDAYTLYLKGRFFFNTLGGGEQFTEPDIRRSLDLYEEALKHDPAFARAYAGIANSWSFLADDWVPPTEAYPRAKAAAIRALELDPALPEAHSALGRILGWFDWDFAAGQQELRRVLVTNPNDADAHFGLGTLLPTTAQYEEAVTEMRRALELDPLAASVSRWLARLLLYARRFDESIEQSAKTLEIDDTFSRAYLDMGHAYLAQGRRQQALDAYRRGQALEGSVVSYNAYDARALAAMGKEDDARKVLAEMEERARRRYIRGEVVAIGYAALGDSDRAFAWLEKAVEARSAGLIYLHVDPAYDPIRGDPRFAAYLEKMGLPVD